MYRAIFLCSLLIGCWLWMQIVHEAGHVCGAWLTGSTVKRVVLHPLAISRTEVEDTTQPLVVIWAGPIFGCIVPLLLWWIAVGVKSSVAFVFRFFAGFCLIANGAYLAAGSFDGIGDCGDLLRHGTPIWVLWLFGLVTIPAGLYLWHRQGEHFGMGHHSKPIPPFLAWSISAVAVATIIAELIWSAV
jgi:hypothetical protein